MAIFSSVLDTIGNTPLVALDRLRSELGVGARIWAKVERFNPSGSVKDRAALYMIEAAERSGKLAPGGSIVESTSGNTGIGLAMVAAAKGYRLILTMPETMSMERRLILAAYGVELVLTPGAKGMSGAIEAARTIAAERGAFMPSQFENPANAEAHFSTTAEEIWRDLPSVAAFVAGVGTAGTIAGTAKGLRAHAPAIRIIGVEPAASPVLSGGNPGKHGLMGIGAGFVPALYDASLVDEVQTVTEAEAYAAARSLAKKEGILAGITSGAALHVALQLAGRAEFAGRDIVALLPDTGERYLSTPLFQEDAQ